MLYLGMGSTGSYMGSSGGGREGVGLGPDSGPFGQMDTWNPAGEDVNGKSKSSNKDAFDNAGRIMINIFHIKAKINFSCPK
jgi:hypothetical protein